MMTVRVDVDLWQRFERTADRSGQAVDDVIMQLMQDYVARNRSADFYGNLAFDFGPEYQGNGRQDQIDLEDFLKAAP